MELTITNAGSQSVPYGPALLSSGSYDGAKLRILIADLRSPDLAPVEFIADPSPVGLACYDTAIRVLARGEQKIVAFAIGAKTISAEGPENAPVSVIVPAFGAASEYSIIASYTLGGQSFASNAVIVRALSAPERALPALERITNLGTQALWLYEVQQMPTTLSEAELAGIVSLAGELPSSLYVDLAQFTLAYYYARRSFNPNVEGSLRIDHAKQALHCLDGIQSVDFKLIDEAGSLRKNLEQSVRK